MISKKRIKSLTKTQILVYQAIITACGEEDATKVTNAQIALIVGCAIETASKCVSRLVEMGYIRVTHIPTQAGTVREIIICA